MDERLAGGGGRLTGPIAKEVPHGRRLVEGTAVEEEVL